MHKFELIELCSIRKLFFIHFKKLFNKIFKFFIDINFYKILNFFKINIKLFNGIIQFIIF